MNLGQAANNYAELGYAVFPCKPGGKAPMTRNGVLDATSDAEQIAAWWLQWPDANIGLSTQGLVVIDLDVDGAGNANPWLANEPHKLLDLAVAPMSLTPRGGKHYIFRQPGYGGLRNTAGKLAQHVDTRADGGYIVAPPSVLEGDRRYRWAGEALTDGPAQLPQPPWWLLLALNGQTASSNRDNRAQAANRIPEGQRNAALASLGGTMRRVGMGLTEILAALREANSGRCVPPLPDDEVQKIAESVARYEADQISVALAEHHAEQDRESDYDVPAGANDPGAFPEELLTVPGFLGQVMAHNLATAFRRQPTLALAGALCLLSTLTGRKIRDAYDTRTNLFCISTCETSSGKDHARKLNKEILYRAGLDKLFGPESIGSSAGLISAVEIEPSCLFQIDEMGRYLATMGDSRQSHLFNIPSVMMKLFTSSNQTYVGDAYADIKKVKRIEQPHAVIYGTTTPEAFYSSLSNDSIYDGFMSRVMVFEGLADAAKNRVEQIDAPATLIEQARWWGDFKPGGNLSSQVPQPAIVPMSEDARAIFADLDELAESERKRLGKPLGSLWPRAVEKAQKLALLWACSESASQPRIDASGARWACRLVDYLTTRLAFLAARWFAENRQEGNSKRLARIIEDAGSDGIDRTSLNRATQWLTRREREDLLTGLVECGEISSRQTDSNRGRPKTYFVHRRHFLLNAVNTNGVAPV